MPLGTFKQSGHLLRCYKKTTLNKVKGAGGPGGGSQAHRGLDNTLGDSIILVEDWNNIHVQQVFHRGNQILLECGICRQCKNPSLSHPV